MTVGGLITITVVVSLACVGLFIAYPFRLLRDQKKLLFTLICFMLIAWVLSNFLSDINATLAAFWIKTSFLSVVLAVFTFLLFGYYFPERERVPRFVRHSVTVGTVITIVAILMPQFMSAVKIEDGISTVVPGRLYGVFIAYFFLVMAYSLYHLIRRMGQLKAKSKQQVAYVLLAVASLVIISSLTNLLIPLLVHNNNLYQLGTASTVLFVGLIGYSMVRHQLFDIRFLIARSLAYFFSLVSVAVLFIATTFVITSYAFSGHIGQLTERLLYAIFAVILAIIFSPLKRWFDKLTNKLFYRDVYDVESVLGELNRILVSATELEDLLSRCSALLAKSLKMEYCSFLVRSSAGKDTRLFGKLRQALSTSELTSVFDLVAGERQEVIATDELLEAANGLKQALIKNDMAALACIIASEAKQKGEWSPIGYIVVGQKLNGDSYNPRDIGLLSIVANELVIAIQNALRFEEIQRFNVTLQEEVDSATVKLKRQNKRLEELDDTKDDFISMASHQLRTPLTSVKGYLSMMIDGDAGTVNPVQDKMLHQAFLSAQRMVFLITDLLNVSRVKTGKFVIDTKPTNLAELIEEEVEQLIETAKTKSLTLHYSRPGDFPDLMLDEVKIRQVVMNFIDNAIYYTPEGGRINVDLIDMPRVVELRITDDGIGVPRNEQQHLFTKFYRAVNARKARPDGTGLGLFMAQKVILAQGGSVIFHSKEGEGSTFGFSFPKDKLRVPEVIIAPIEA